MPQINGQEVGPIGYGLMNLTWRPDPPSEETAFASIRAAVRNGATFLNGGEFYGTPAHNSLTLLARYFARYPEDASKTCLSVKGAINLANFHPDSSPEGIRRSIDACLAYLDGKKKIDVFEAARRDPKVPLAETFGILQREYIDKGLLGGIALSEVSAATVHEAVKVARIVAVEVELSLFSTECLTNGIAAACRQYDIPLVAYSPVGRGMLTGAIKSLDDIPEGDMRRSWPRFQPENFATNIKLVEQVRRLAEKKGVTAAQMAIAWVRWLSGRPGMPIIIPIPGASSPERVEENCRLVTLTDEEAEEINETLARFEVAGTRYPAGMPVNT